MAVEKPGTANKPNGKVVQYFPSRVKDHVPMPGLVDRTDMLAGFEGVTINTGLGTAAQAFSTFPLTTYPVAGKTGTAQVDGYCATGTACPPGDVPWPAYKQDTSVFASFAPALEPRFVVDAVFEQAGYGANVAAPAVEQEYLALFGLDHRPATGGTTTTAGARGAAG